MSKAHDTFVKAASGDAYAERRARVLEMDPGEDRAAVYGQRLLAAVKNLLRDDDSIFDAVSLIENDADVNLQDPRTRMTPLHMAASMGCRPLVRALVNSGRCNYLLQDRKGNYPCESAIESTRDSAVVNLLQKKQVRQAFERGVPAHVPATEAPALVADLAP
jgi:ankyrin repeat protein